VKITEVQKTIVIHRDLVFFWSYSVADEAVQIFLLHHSVRSTVLKEDNDEDGGKYASQTTQNIQHYTTLVRQTTCALKHQIYNIGKNTKNTLFYYT